MTATAAFLSSSVTPVCTFPFLHALARHVHLTNDVVCDSKMLQPQTLAWFFQCSTQHFLVQLRAHQRKFYTKKRDLPFGGVRSNFSGHDVTSLGAPMFWRSQNNILTHFYCTNTDKWLRSLLLSTLQHMRLLAQRAMPDCKNTSCWNSWSNSRHPARKNFFERINMKDIYNNF